MKNKIVTLGTFLVLAAMGRTQDADAERILERFQALRPTVGDLAAYRLDWAKSLAEAKERARSEDRPILLFTIRTITGYGDLYSGHC